MSLLAQSESYLGNPNVKRDGILQEWTQDSVLEYAKCMKNDVCLRICYPASDQARRADHFQCQNPYFLTLAFHFLTLFSFGSRLRILVPVNKVPIGSWACPLQQD